MAPDKNKAGRIEVIFEAGMRLRLKTGQEVWFPAGGILAFMRPEGD